ncbi:MAG: hypothetical protein ABJE47_23895 [bacterium]
MKYDHGKAEPFHRLFDQLNEWGNREFGDDDEATSAIARTAAQAERAVQRLGVSAAATLAESRVALWLFITRTWNALPFQSSLTPRDVARAIVRELTHVREACNHGSAALYSVQALTPALPHGWLALFKAPRPEAATISQWLGLYFNEHPERATPWADFMRAVGHAYDNHHDAEQARTTTVERERPAVTDASAALDHVTPLPSGPRPGEV